ncbi:MAG: tRNA pseudouridine(55) synthase TruB [Synergistaceae bacterium]|jgi:tRNA pseudouridine(55) synthase|nr:tRNA pseudouridine(55) synthase TruB [Synergistaceae bacterium]
MALNKPIGMRSTKCVEEVRRVLGREWPGTKVGHGGTLDSSASGLLVMLVSSATRLSGIVMSMPKVYRAIVCLGKETSTCDFAGEEVFSADWRSVSEADIDRALCSFAGWRNQQPPKVSAVHVGGRRAHEITRSGGDPELQARPVFVESLVRHGAVSESGEFALTIRCGKGTYVRAIARDIGRSLGCGAHLSSLTRESVGCFSISNAAKFSEAGELESGELRRAMTPLSVLSDFLPTYAFPDEDMRRLENGLAAPFGHAVRKSFGRFAPEGVIAFASGGTFSIARLKRLDGEFWAAPEINIFDRTDSEVNR